MNDTNCAAKKMTAAEIERQVLLGWHGDVKAALAPVMGQVSAALGWAPARVMYDGCGGVLVQLDLCSTMVNGLTETAQWNAIWMLARAVRAALPGADFRVSKPRRGGVNGGTFTITRDSFHVNVR